jgi:hypothetical protein
VGESRAQSRVRCVCCAWTLPSVSSCTEQYRRERSHRLQTSVTFGMRSVLSVSVTAGMGQPCATRFDISSVKATFRVFALHFSYALCVKSGEVMVFPTASPFCLRDARRDAYVSEVAPQGSSTPSHFSSKGSATSLPCENGKAMKATLKPNHS